MSVVLVMMLLVVLWLSGGSRFTDFGKGLLDGWHIRFVGIIGDGHGLFFHVENKVSFTPFFSSLSKGIFFRILLQQSSQCRCTYNTTFCLFGFASAVLSTKAIGNIAIKKIINRFIYFFLINLQPSTSTPLVPVPNGIPNTVSNRVWAPISSTHHRSPNMD